MTAECVPVELNPGLELLCLAGALALFWHLGRGRAKDPVSRSVVLLASVTVVRVDATRSPAPVEYTVLASGLLVCWLTDRGWRRVGSASRAPYFVTAQPTPSLPDFTRCGSSTSTSSIVSAIGNSANTRCR